MWIRGGVVGSTNFRQHYRSSLLVLFCMGSAIGLALLPGSPSAFGKSTDTRSTSVIACFHKKVNRSTAEAHPRRCNISGYEGKKMVEVAVEGMKWGHWGSNPTRAAFGVDASSERRVRIIAHRPINCGDGRAWYSRVVVVYPGNGTFFGLRLPVCNN